MFNLDLIPVDTIVSITDEPAFDGRQVIVTFTNGYAVSIIQHGFSYGTEMAVLHPTSLCYATPVTDDVLGYLTPSTLKDALYAVASLPVNNDCTHG